MPKFADRYPRPQAVKRILHVVLVSAVIPSVLIGQQAAAGQRPVGRAVGAVTTRYGKWLIAAFDSIPAEKYAFRPTPAQQTIGYIAQHLESSNYALCSFFAAAKYVKTGRDSVTATIRATWPKDTLVSRLRASLAFCDAAMSSLPDSGLSAAIPGGPTGVRADFVLGWITDLADHYSQIANYMRLNGLLPPSAIPERAVPPR